MQVILNEKEYTELANDKLELIKLKDKVSRLVIIHYNNDSNFLKHIIASVYSVTIDTNSLIDMLSIRNTTKEEIKRIIELRHIDRQ